ncbi:MAG: hypothetical protein ACI36V_06350 [Coriobacteriales bacterium]
MDAEVSGRVAAFLEARGLQADLLPKSTVKLLGQADESLEKRICATRKARAAIKDNKITVTAIAKDVGVVRKTVYNNPVVLDYIGWRAREVEAADADTVKRLRVKLADLEDQVGKLVQRDAAEEELKLELNRMQGIISEREAQIRSLQDDNARLRRALGEARSKLPPEEGKVIDLSTKKGKRK